MMLAAGAGCLLYRGCCARELSLAGLVQSVGTLEPPPSPEQSGARSCRQAAYQSCQQSGRLRAQCCAHSIFERSMPSCVASSVETGCFPSRKHLSQGRERVRELQAGAAARLLPEQRRRGGRWLCRNRCVVLTQRRRLSFLANVLKTNASLSLQICSCSRPCLAPRTCTISHSGDISRSCRQGGGAGGPTAACAGR